MRDNVSLQVADYWASEGIHLVLSYDDVGGLFCECGYPDVCSAHALLLSPISLRERRRDLELGQGLENGKITRRCKK
jgi:hypothetical protein